MRTPRKHLYQTVTPSDAGSYCARYGHDEDCKYGLNVTNAAGNAWLAYGDKKYFDTVDAKNKVLVDKTVQTSVVQKRSSRG